MLNVKHAVELSASANLLEMDAPSFLINTESNIIREANSQAIAGCDTESLTGKHLSEVLYVEENLETAQKPTFFNGQWMLGIQETVLWKGKPHIKVTLNERDSLPDMAMLESLKKMMGLLMHRVRSPLTGIQGYVELARENEEELQESHYLDKIDAGVDQLLDLLDELEKMQEVSSEYINGSYSASSGKIIRHLLSDYQEKNRQRITITDELHNMPCSPGDLQRILSILIDNAVAYSDSSKASISIDQPSSHAIRIAHNGTPIPTSIAEHLFSPFVTSKATTLGIGLTTALLYAKRYKASLFLTRNSPFKGVAFTLCFPPAELI